ncbi:MAG: hypothetical protein CL908_06480 [Deltaproteobacteria bacterium]|nr:hypothetical protein [Deltaproteobacteria bacterium]
MIDFPGDAACERSAEVGIVAIDLEGQRVDELLATRARQTLVAASSEGRARWAMRRKSNGR